LETDSETNIYYLPPLDLIDISKDELHIRLDRYNEKNELVYSDFQLLTNYLKFD
jgi:hypothetical protein